MLRKRIIFALIYSDGLFTQSRNFRLQKVGDINWLEKNYKFREIAFSLDELVVINASKEDKNNRKFAEMVSALVDDVFVPVCAGGGIRKQEDAERLFNNGADKILVNSILMTDPDVVSDLVYQYGSQSIVASVDYKMSGGVQEVYIGNGAQKIDMSLPAYLTHIESLGIGEIYLNSIDKDGTGFGYDFDVIRSLTPFITRPLIIAGGAGNENHLVEGLKMEKVSAVATANLFNFIGNGLPAARARAINEGNNIVDWKAGKTN